MKLFLLISSISFGCFSSTVDAIDFLIDGSQGQFNGSLHSQKSQTEYKVVKQKSTCTRRVFDGFETSCEYLRNMDKVCRNSARYLKEEYECEVNVREQEEVFKYNVIANVTINIKEKQQLFNLNERITAKLAGENLWLEVKDSREYLITFEKKVNTSWEGAVRILDINYDLNFISKEKVLGPLEMGITDIHLDKRALTYSLMGNVNSDYYIHEIQIFRNQLFRKNKTIFSGKLRIKNIQTEEAEEMTSYRLDLSKENVLLKRGKYSVRIFIGLNISNEKVLNAKSFKRYSSYSKKSGKIR